jgi:anti-sigma regulatory factor (Ser/Thr protein kinase)
MSQEPGEVLPHAAIRVELACELSAVRGAVHRVCEFLIGLGFTAEEVSGCELALVEACNNAIDHSTPTGRRDPVVIRALATAHSLNL